MISIANTDSVAQRDRVAFWNDAVSDAFTALEVSPLESERFAACLKSGSLGQIGIAEALSRGSNVAHTKSQISRETEAFFLIHLQLEGSSVNRQAGREAVLQAGDFTLCDTTRPYSVSFKEDNRMLVMRVAESKLSNIIAAPYDLTCIAVHNDNHAGALTSNFLTQIWQTLGDLPDNQAQAQHLERMVLDSLAFGLSELAQCAASQSSCQRSKRVQIVDFIEDKLTEPDLTPARTASAFNISTRYLHQLFSAHGESVSQYILRRRLEQAAIDLPLATSKGKTISEVAFALGFNSLTHFGRVFREKYSVSPKVFIQQQSR